VWRVHRREFMHRLSVVLHGALGSYLRDAWQKGGVADVACLLLRGLRFPCMFFIFSLLVDATPFFV
jgi:hypothetical protein